MAEPTGRELEIIQDTFLAAYNGVHATRYAPSPRPPTEPTDLLFDDPAVAEPLRVQLVRAVGDPESEFAHPAAVEKFIIEPLLQCLRRMRSQGFVVSVSVDRLPKTAAEKHR